MRGRWIAGMTGFLVGLVVIVIPMMFVLATQLTIGWFIAPVVFTWVGFIAAKAHSGAFSGR